MKLIKRRLSFMKNKLKLFSILFIVATMVLAGCGKDEKDDKAKEVASIKDDDKEEKDEKKKDKEKKEEKPEEKKDEKKEEKEEPESKGDDEVMNPQIAEETDGDVEVIYTNDDPGYTSDLDGLKVDVHKYQVVKLTDMNKSQDITFDDNLEGYAVTIDVTTENTRDKPVIYNNSMDIRTDDRNDYMPFKMNHFVAEDKNVEWGEGGTGVFEPGDKQDFFMVASLTNDQFDKIESSDAKFIIEGGVSEDLEGFSDQFGEEEVFDFTYSEESDTKSADAPEFYKDKLTTENIADKEILFEDTELDMTEKIGDAEITIEGVQFTEITPTKANKEMFSDFEDGIVALTLQVSVDNQSDEMIYNDGFNSWINANDGEARYQSQGSLENDSGREIQPGETGERQLVYVFDQKYYDLYEDFDLEMGPFFGEEGYLFKEQEAEFELPAEKSVCSQLLGASGSSSQCWFHESSMWSKDYLFMDTYKYRLDGIAVQPQ